MVNDPIADMITRIRNAAKVKKESVDMPASKEKMAVADILFKEGYITAYRVIADDKQGVLRVTLKYYDSKHVISRIQRVSKPGRRVYKGVDELPVVRDGLGIAIISTSKGIMSNVSARKSNIGGEVLVTVW